MRLAPHAGLRLADVESLGDQPAYHAHPHAAELQASFATGLGALRDVAAAPYALRHEKLQAASASFRHMLTLESRDLRACLALCYIFFTLGDFHTAFEYLNRAGRIDAAHPLIAGFQQALDQALEDKYRHQLAHSDFSREFGLDEVPTARQRGAQQRQQQSP